MQENPSGEFRYVAVEKRLSTMISSGVLGPGDKLPSLRSMRARTGMSMSTVNQAYLELERKGLIEARPRSGYYVRPGGRRLPKPVPSWKGATRPEPVTRNALIRSVLESLGNEEICNFAVAMPDPRLFPHKALARCTASVLREQGARAIDYDHVAGNAELRRQIAFRAMDAGARLSGEDIIVTDGALEALYIALRTLTRPGDNVLIQSPTYYCFLQLLETLGVRAIEIPSHPERGVEPADLHAALARDVRACVLAPNYNNPDGACTPDAAQREVVAMLAERDIPLVEDDVWGDLHFSDQRPGTYKQYDEKGLVLQCSSFSKTLAPGYRIGWLAPGRFRTRAQDIKTTTNVGAATPMQMAVAEYLKAGQYDRHLRRLRATIEKQMRTMQVAVGRAFPKGTRMTDPTGGTELWVELPGVNAIRYFQEAMARGMGVCPGPVFSTQDKYNNYVRISAGRIWSDEVAQGVEALGQLAGELTGNGS